MFAVSSVRRALSFAVIAGAAPIVAQAQDTQLFTWSGRVDRELRITVRSGSIIASTERDFQTHARAESRAALPHREGHLRIVVHDGRGRFAVEQQPTARNGYVALIRITDDEGGADNYRFTAWFDDDSRRGNDRGNKGRGDNGRRDDGRRDDDRRGNDSNNGRWGRDDDRNGRRDSDATLRFSGDIDGEVLLMWREGSVSQRVVRGSAVRSDRTSVSGDFSNRRDSDIRLSVREGRGRVEVVQEPNARNRYTGIIRIIDPQGGYGRYTFEATIR